MVVLAFPEPWRALSSEFVFAKTGSFLGVKAESLPSRRLYQPLQRLLPFRLRLGPSRPCNRRQLRLDRCAHLPLFGRLAGFRRPFASIFGPSRSGSSGNRSPPSSGHATFLPGGKCTGHSSPTRN